MKKEEDSNSLNDFNNNMEIDDFLEDNNYFVNEKDENFNLLTNNDNNDTNNSNIPKIIENPKHQKKRKREKSASKEGSPLINKSLSKKKLKIFHEKSKYNFKQILSILFFAPFLNFSDNFIHFNNFFKNNKQKILTIN